MKFYKINVYAIICCCMLVTSPILSEESKSAPIHQKKGIRKKNKKGKKKDNRFFKIIGIPILFLAGITSIVYYKKTTTKTNENNTEETGSGTNGSSGTGSGTGGSTSTNETNGINQTSGTEEADDFENKTFTFEEASQIVKEELEKKHIGDESYISPNLKFIVGQGKGADNNIYFFDRSGKTKEALEATSALEEVAISFNSQYIAYIEKDKNADNKQMLKVYNIQNLAAPTLVYKKGINTSQNANISWHPSQNVLVWMIKTEVGIWNEKGAEKIDIGNMASGTYMKWYPVGNKVAFISGDKNVSVQVYDFGTKETISFKTKSGDAFRDSAFSADGQYLAFSILTEKGKNYREWPCHLFIKDLNNDKREENKEIQLENSYRYLTWGGDAQFLLIQGNTDESSDDTLSAIYDCKNRNLVYLSENFVNVKWSPREKFYAAVTVIGDKEKPQWKVSIYKWNEETKQFDEKWSKNTESEKKPVIAWATKNNILAIGDGNGTVSVHQLMNDGSVKEVSQVSNKKHDSMVGHILWANDDLTFMTFTDGGLQFWKVKAAT